MAFEKRITLLEMIMLHGNTVQKREGERFLVETLMKNGPFQKDLDQSVMFCGTTWNSHVLGIET